MQSGDTQVEIARHVGISQSYLSRIISGRSIPHGLLAARLAAYAQVPLDSFTRAYIAHRGARIA